LAFCISIASFDASGSIFTVERALDLTSLASQATRDPVKIMSAPAAPSFEQGEIID
jgi:hypothetical protein